MDVRLDEVDGWNLEGKGLLRDSHTPRMLCAVGSKKDSYVVQLEM
jgi:hypothetical protein